MNGFYTHPGMRIRSKNTPRVKTKGLIALGAGGAIAALLFASRRRLPRLRTALANKVVLLAGLIGSMATILVLLFRAIRFLVRLYP